MEALILLLAVTVPGLIGALASAWLCPWLQSMLADLCQGADRAAFWTRMIALALVLGPVAWALRMPTTSADIITVLHTLLTAGIDGLLGVTGLLALLIYRRIPQPPVVTPQATENPS